MSDPVIISQIISSLGLTGKDAESKRAELEKLSLDELNKIIANIPEFKKTSLGGFSLLEKNAGFDGQVFGSSIVDSPFLGVEFSPQSYPPPPETLIPCR